MAVGQRAYIKKANFVPEPFFLHKIGTKSFCILDSKCSKKIWLAHFSRSAGMR